MIRGIGSIVVAILLMAIPILTALSFVYSWGATANYFLIIGALIEIVGLTFAIYNSGAE